MSENIKSIVFAIVLAIVSSLLLAIVTTGLKTYQIKNIQIDKQKNILLAMGLIDDNTKYSNSEIEEFYNKNIKTLFTDETGHIDNNEENTKKRLPIYIYQKNDNIDGYIIPINAKGLWGKINGYMALKNDGSTIVGFTVYKHQETPGLGGEIESKWFRKNFHEKKIINQAGDFVSIGIAKGKVNDQIAKDKQINYVDGISGATLTGKYLSESFKDILSEYETVSLKFRTKNYRR